MLQLFLEVVVFLMPKFEIYTTPHPICCAVTRDLPNPTHSKANSDTIGPLLCLPIFCKTRRLKSEICKLSFGVHLSTAGSRASMLADFATSSVLLLRHHSLS
ncbi:hypothetical protein TorRG33x02_040330 [Trema orientale]|uniref:Uncharacterized protein n=1 Tax=Trema orientale TaxID=63057 RepID=A0A2P5FR31_TREOI|nr:hypothetical protein TorRG33x02_040330 [Trema orientale]